MYIGDIKIKPAEIANIWLGENESIPEKWEEQVDSWLREWIETHHVEYEYHGNRYLPEDMRRNLLTCLRNQCKQKIEKEYDREHSIKTKGWLKNYRKTSAYHTKLKICLSDCQEYQQLSQEGYEECQYFQQAKKKHEESEYMRTLEGVCESIRNKEKQIALEEGVKYLETIDLRKRSNTIKLYDVIFHRIERHLVSQTIKWKNPDQFSPVHTNRITKNTLPIFLDTYVDYLLDGKITTFMDNYSSILHFAAMKIGKSYPKLTEYMNRNPKLLKMIAKKLDAETDIAVLFPYKLKEYFSEEKIMECLVQNPRYRELVMDMLEKRKIEERIRKGILDRIPERYIDLYPAARCISRHFILHLGPTNSGKTYESMQAFRKAKSGIYLAPLRLLAYEVYEDSNRLGCPCNMVTGEEEQIIEGASHTACTIEMANFFKYYDVCVIDEAQMIADRDRGGAWTSAILGIQADEIHICGSESCKDLLLRLIGLCGDTYEIQNHERSVPLILESQQFTFPESVRKDDALIVFSKRHVLQVAAELQKKKWKVSVVYGSLPYEARRREIERYINGQTDVIVATDAIGMGMNLPIARVVFLETEKYDGVMRRPLLEQEVKQIAGRAGRRGIFEIGVYNAEYGKKHVEHMMKEPSYIPEKAYLDFPEPLLSVEGKLSDLLNKWNDLPNENIFLKQNLEEEIKLAKELEEMTDDKDMIYKFVTIPFQTESLAIKDLWKQLFQLELSKEYPDSFLMEFLDQDELSSYSLEQLEEEYKKCDLLYNYFRKFKLEDEKEFLIHYKRTLADQISDYLAKQQLPVKKCRECGRALPWIYPYRICNKCHMASSYGFGSLRMANGIF